MLVSRALLRFFTGAEIHNEVLPDESGAFPSRTTRRSSRGFHCPEARVSAWGGALRSEPAAARAWGGARGADPVK